MASTFLLMAVLLALVAAYIVLHFEITEPDAPFTRALRTWQTGLGALFGFLAVAATIFFQNKAADDLQRKQMMREGTLIALSMQYEAFEIRRWMKALTTVLETAEPPEKSDKTAWNVSCAVFIQSAKRLRYDSPGIIDAHRANVGKIPNVYLGIHLLDLLNRHRILLTQIANGTQERCANDGQMEISILREEIANVKTALDRVDTAMRQLPETGTSPVEY